MAVNDLDQEISALLEELNSTDAKTKTSSISFSPNEQQSRFLEQEHFIRQQTTTLDQQDENLSTELNPKFEGFLQEVAKMFEKQQMSQQIKTGCCILHFFQQNLLNKP